MVGLTGRLIKTVPIALRDPCQVRGAVRSTSQEQAFALAGGFSCSLPCLDAQAFGTSDISAGWPTREP